MDNIIKPRRALISVTDKTNLKSLAQHLVQHNIEIIASGGTAKYLQEHNIPVILVADITNFAEILNGRVKTLHPNIYAGILARKDNNDDLQDLTSLNIQPLDIVIVNLYDFEQASKDTANLDELIESIDIGGVSLIRSCAKNYKYNITLTNPSQYAEFIELTQDNFEQVSQETRSQYALEAFRLTAQYDNIIHQELSKNLTNIKDFSTLRYGENPHQDAVLLQNTNIIPDNTYGYEGIQSIQKLSGKDLSYNNWLDIDMSLNLISEFEEEIPVCSIVKHNIPCGVAFGNTVEESFIDALDCDPISAFGGVVSFNNKVDLATAKHLTQIFLEIIIAPDYDQDALEYLKGSKPNLRVIQTPLIPSELQTQEIKTILHNGSLQQSKNHQLFDSDKLKTVTKTKSDDKEDWLQMIFALKVVKHLKSNAIVITKGNKAVGISGGKTNRVNAVQEALTQASDLATDGILASDGFFPFADSIELIVQARIKGIIQPGGSIKDKDVIEACDKYKIPMIMTYMRHFKH